MTSASSPTQGTFTDVSAAHSGATGTPTPPSRGLDPRGPRVAAAITTVVLAAALLLSSPWLLSLQAAVFAVAVVRGPASSPYSLFFRHVIRPRLAAPPYLEDPAAPRFAQACGLAFAAVGLLGFALGAQWLAIGAIAAAFAAAFLNAAFDLCLGCEIYLRAQRLRNAVTS